MKKSMQSKYKKLPEGKHNTVGDKIREIRVKKNISQGQLAELVKQKGLYLEQKQISAIEIGKRQIVDYELYIFAECLGVKLVDLYKPAVPVGAIKPKNSKPRLAKTSVECELVCMNLAPIMQQQRLSIGAVQRSCGISRGTVQRILKSNGLVHERTVKKVADGLGVDVSDLTKKPSTNA